MAYTGRLSQIYAYLKNCKRASVAELSARFFASESSIRRDLAELEKSGCVTRYYGGAAFTGSLDAYDMRVNVSSDLKQRIAERGAALVSDGQTVFLDSSSTASFTVQYLSGFKGLNIVTNCIDTAVKASQYDFDVYVAGGNIRSPSFSVVGSQAVDFFKDFHADVAFISCTSYRASYGCFEGFKVEVPVKKTIVSNSEKTVLLCDSTKLEAPASFASVGNPEINVMVTDRGISEEERSVIGRKAFKLIVLD